MVIYVPGTEETDQKKQNMSLQQLGGATSVLQTAVGSNTSNISALQTKTNGYEAAWTTYTPTITSQTGAITSASAAGAYLAVGKLIHFCVTVTITTAGTGAGNVILTLPSGTSKRPFAIAGCETAIGGKQLGGFGATSGGTHTVRNYDVTTAIANGAVLTVTGIYEQT